MMKTKRIIRIVLPAALLLLTVGSWLLFGPKDRIVYGISEGTYRLVTEDDSEFAPYIHFDMTGETARFVFGADPRMSFAYTGTVELNGKVTAHTENGGETWIFEVIDNDTIALSSAVPLNSVECPCRTALFSTFRQIEQSAHKTASTPCRF